MSIVTYEDFYKLYSNEQVRLSELVKEFSPKVRSRYETVRASNPVVRMLVDNSNFDIAHHEEGLKLLRDHYSEDVDAKALKAIEENYDLQKNTFENNLIANLEALATTLDQKPAIFNILYEMMHTALNSTAHSKILGQTEPKPSGGFNIQGFPALTLEKKEKNAYITTKAEYDNTTRFISFSFKAALGPLGIRLDPELFLVHELTHSLDHAKPLDDQPGTGFKYSSMVRASLKGAKHPTLLKKLEEIANVINSNLAMEYALDSLIAKNNQDGEETKDSETGDTFNTKSQVIQEFPAFMTELVCQQLTYVEQQKDKTLALEDYVKDHIKRMDSRTRAMTTAVLLVSAAPILDILKASNESSMREAGKIVSKQLSDVLQSALEHLRANIVSDMKNDPTYSSHIKSSTLAFIEQLSKQQMTVVLTPIEIQSIATLAGYTYASMGSNHLQNLIMERAPGLPWLDYNTELINTYIKEKKAQPLSYGSTTHTSFVSVAQTPAQRKKFFKDTLLAANNIFTTAQTTDKGKQTNSTDKLYINKNTSFVSVAQTPAQRKKFFKDTLLAANNEDTLLAANNIFTTAQTTDKGKQTNSTDKLYINKNINERKVKLT